MADLEHGPTEPEIKSDDAWKVRVKAEDAQRDAEQAMQGGAEHKASKSRSSEFDPSQLPKPAFSTLVGLFSTQAMVSLGLLSHPEDGEVHVQLPLARHFIDLLGVLEDKTRGNLSEGEGQLLEQSLHDLRMAYLERSRA
ncbi:MAG: DUF1844 domain-containing protein [Planctomycetaceae bacterium]